MDYDMEENIIDTKYASVKAERMLHRIGWRVQTAEFDLRTAEYELTLSKRVNKDSTAAEKKRDEAASVVEAAQAELAEAIKKHEQLLDAYTAAFDAGEIAKAEEEALYKAAERDEFEKPCYFCGEERCDDDHSSEMRDICREADRRSF